MDGDDEFELNDDGSAKVDKDGNKIKKPAGGAGGDNKTVPYEAHQRLLDQRKTDKKNFDAMKTQLDELLAKDRSNQDKANQDNGNFKALFEDRDTQLKAALKENGEVKKKLETFEASFTEARKISALKDKIGGTLKKKEYYNHIDTDKIAIDSTTGEIDESSLTAYAGQFVKDFKELIQFNTGKLPNGAAAGGGVGLTYEAWLKLPLAEQRARMQEVRKQ